MPVRYKKEGRPVWLSLFFASSRALSYDVRQEDAEDQHREATEKHIYRLLVATLPLLEDDAPDIGEYHIEAHQDAPAEGQQDRGCGEESLAEAEAEELAVPEKAGEGAEDDVVPPERALGVVAESLVLAVLVEAVAGVGEESSEGYEHRGRKSLEQRCRAIEAEIFTETQSDVEAGAHQAADHGDHYALAEVEVLDGLLPLLFRKRSGFHRTGDAYDGDAYDGDYHSDNHSHREAGRLAGEDRSEDPSEAGAESEADALAEGYAEIAHPETESQASHTPEGAEEDGEPCRLRVCSHEGEKVSQSMSLRNREKRSEQREDEPGEHALDKPVALPAPFLDLIDRNIAAGLAESPSSYDKKS